MGLLLRSAGLVLAMSGLLVLVSVGAGQMSDAKVVSGNLEVDQLVYILYIEDRGSYLRMNLAGTRCFPAPPDWIKPDAAPVPYYAQFFLRRGSHLVRELAQCRPQKSRPDTEMSLNSQE